MPGCCGHEAVGVSLEQCSSGWGNGQQADKASVQSNSVAPAICRKGRNNSGSARMARSFCAMGGKIQKLELVKYST